MITFFRRIRKGLLGTGTTSKYLLYAIGEIALVVIGILIALQINNWNEEGKEALFERTMYKELIMSIERNIEQLEKGVLYSEEVIQSCHIILDQLEKDFPYHDSLASHFAISLRWWHPSLGNQAYESLKTHYGLHILKNDTIRERLGSLNDLEWMDFLIKQQEDYFSNTIGPILPDLFKEYSVEQEMEPYNFNQLRSSKKYNHILESSINMRERQIRWYKSSIRGREITVALINRELDGK